MKSLTLMNGMNRFSIRFIFYPSARSSRYKSNRMEKHELIESIRKEEKSTKMVFLSITIGAFIALCVGIVTLLSGWLEREISWLIICLAVGGMVMSVAALLYVHYWHRKHPWQQA